MTGAGLEGRRAFVTGASRGVGAAVARRFAEEGARVALASRSGDGLGIGLGLKCDVSDAEQVGAAVSAAVSELGGLDVVVANAGVGAYGGFLDLAPQHIEQMIDVNLKGTLYTARAALPHLIEAGGGDFVSLASVAGLRALPGETVYNASKFGQVGFTRSLDHEMREHGVRCTCVCPGGVATDFALRTGRPREALAGMMSAEEAAEVVVFCVTRPRGVRMLTVSYRPADEPSWG
ncbi:MAG TPA: SDR family oxidoreductase [Solirubrobacteraceae bacterium]|nr:SDR family oxidoreductase [Solirubrobacteraceae bacterium]